MSIFLSAAYFFAFDIGLGPITWIYIPDILPDVGVACCSAVLWIFTLIIASTFSIIENRLNQGFTGFLICSLFGLLFIKFYIKETKGKS